MMKTKPLLFLTSLLQFYKSLVMVLTFGNEILKVEDVIIVDNQKFKKTRGGNEGGAFVANSSCKGSNSCVNNSRNRSSLRPQVELINKEYFFLLSWDVLYSIDL